MTREVLDALEGNSEFGIMNSELAQTDAAPVGEAFTASQGSPTGEDAPVGEELAPPADMAAPRRAEQCSAGDMAEEFGIRNAEFGICAAPRRAEHRSAPDPATDPAGDAAVGEALAASRGPGPMADGGTSQSASLTAPLAGEPRREGAAPDHSEFRIHNSELYSHYAALCAQEAALRAEFPDFRLAEALRDPAFLRLTAPATGVPPRAAWLALHPEALERRAEHRARQQAAEDARRQLALAVSAGSLRPREGGGQQAAALLESDPRRLPPRARQELRQRILDAAARGEKIYP